MAENTASTGDVIHRRAVGRQFVPWAVSPGVATIASLVGPDISRSMGAGIATFDGCSVEWTVLYDEVIVVLEGLFRLRLGTRIIEGGPGDVIWIPENTALRYEGEKAKVFYALSPVDWRQRHGIA